MLQRVAGELARRLVLEIEPVCKSHLYLYIATNAVTLEQFGELLGEDEIMLGEGHSGHVLVDVAEHQLNFGN